MLRKNGAFFSQSELTRKLNFHFLANELKDLLCTIISLSWNWEIIFFLSNNYKPILSAGKGTFQKYQFNKYMIYIYLEGIAAHKRAWYLPFLF